MFPGQIGNLFHLAGGNVASVNPADATALGVYFEHDTHGAFLIHPEDALQHMNDKVHGREIVIEQQHLVERRRSNDGVFAFKERGAFLGFAMGCHGVNVRPVRQIFNASCKNRVESGR